jgi:hypothetical protein
MPTNDEWAALWRLFATALPVLALLLPATGYAVRWIAFSVSSWIPSHIALYAPISELALTGLSSVIGGGLGLGLFVILAFRRSGMYIYPFAYWRETWRDVGPTKERRARIGRRIESIRSALGRVRGASWSFKSLRLEVGLLRSRMAAYLARPGAKRKLIVWPFLALAPLPLVAAALSSLYIVILAIVGVTLGAAIQSVATYIALLRLDHLARTSPSIDVRHIAPLILAYVAACALGAGFNPTFPLRPATYNFEPTSGLTSGLYQEIGRTDGLLYLVSCGPPPAQQVLTVQISEVRSSAFLATYAPAPRPKLLDILSRLPEIGFQPCA